MHLPGVVCGGVETDGHVLKNERNRATSKLGRDFDVKMRLHGTGVSDSRQRFSSSDRGTAWSSYGPPRQVPQPPVVTAIVQVEPVRVLPQLLCHRISLGRAKVRLELAIRSIV
jgi:hypothetical protein